MHKKIGIYGGSFDPIHLGHLNLAIEIMETRLLDEVWFCPSSQNPHKLQGSSAKALERIDMINIAIAGEPRFRLLDIEIQREGLSYTVDTLKTLSSSQFNKNDPCNFNLILGEDAARCFFKWSQPEEILTYANLLIGRRSCELEKESFKFNGSDKILKAINQGLTFTRIMDISSTEIRHRLGQRLYCDHLVPRKVLDYIMVHHLYLLTH